jgi:serine/threonine-protein kinase
VVLGAKLALLGILGWGIGWLVVTQVLLPAPPPPTDLVTVPDLHGLAVREGEVRLAAEGLALGIVDSLAHPSVARGLILGQSPLPGQRARRGTDVRVMRSLGPETRALPDVRNVDASRARVVLETSGLVVLEDSVESEIPRGRVVSTSPAAGTRVALPSEIRVLVSLGPALIPMPYLLGLQQADALALLDSIGLVLGSVEEVPGQEWERGIVLGQEPKPDSLVERGSAVRLAVGRRGG